MISRRGVGGKVSEMKAHGLTFVENSASELVASVAEMLKFADNKLVYSQQDLSLLAQFSEALVKSGYPSVLKEHSHPSISFLKNHQTALFGHATT
jgi:hypothetical protein